MGSWGRVISPIPTSWTGFGDHCMFAQRGPGRNVGNCSTAKNTAQNVHFWAIQIPLLIYLLTYLLIYTNEYESMRV